LRFIELNDFRIAPRFIALIIRRISW